MNTYSDGSKCIKCGCDQVRTIYHKAEKSYTFNRCSLEILEEHMHRICERCGYSWAEKPLDEKWFDSAKYKEAEKEVESLGQKFKEFKIKNLGSMSLNEVKQEMNCTKDHDEEKTNKK